jgi:adenosylmethionine-8-amino-7-oxononanoate aminotransferase
LRGLMGAVELVPPAGESFSGRRVSAAAVERGVLLRSIGDNVTLMPPLTITSEEIHRIVHVLGEAIDQETSPP